MERPLTTEELGPPEDPTTPLGRRFASHSDATEPLADPGAYAPDGRRILGRYRLERKLGAGGFGVVWLAFDEKLEREVAIKVIQIDGDDPVLHRAAREARVAARLNHPGIVSLYELGEDDEAVYLVSELVPGRTMAELVRAGAVSDRDVARIGVALCDALAHAHDRKVVHRDVKPQNVIVVAEPAAGAGFAKLADFGVAQLAVGDALTRTGDVVGTLAYMSPEQAEGGRVTAAADVYSLALTLYEAWAGVNPVRGPTPAATARRLGRRLPLLSAYRPDLPPDLCAWIDSALDPYAARRPGLDALRDALVHHGRDLGDKGGLAAPETQERVGIAHTTAILPLPSRRAQDLVTRALAGIAAAALVLAGDRDPRPGPDVPRRGLDRRDRRGRGAAAAPRLARGGDRGHGLARIRAARRDRAGGRTRAGRRPAAAPARRAAVVCARGRPAPRGDRDRPRVRGPGRPRLDRVAPRRARRRGIPLGRRGGAAQLGRASVRARRRTPCRAANGSGRSAERWTTRSPRS